MVGTVSLRARGLLGEGGPLHTPGFWPVEALSWVIPRSLGSLLLKALHLRELLWRVTKNEVQIVPSLLSHCSLKSLPCRVAGMQDKKKKSQSHSHPLCQCLAQSARCCLDASTWYLHKTFLIPQVRAQRQERWRDTARIPTHM